MHSIQLGTCSCRVLTKTRAVLTIAGSLQALSRPFSFKGRSTTRPIRILPGASRLLSLGLLFRRHFVRSLPQLTEKNGESTFLGWNGNSKSRMANTKKYRKRRKIIGFGHPKESSTCIDQNDGVSYSSPKTYLANRNSSTMQVSPAAICSWRFTTGNGRFMPSMGDGQRTFRNLSLQRTLQHRPIHSPCARQRTAIKLR